MQLDSRWLAAPDALRWIGLDVGGANLKVADGRGRAESRAFELWRSRDRLTETLHELLAGFVRESPHGVALTMTGELADCYRTKAEGVCDIVSATSRAAGATRVVVAGVDDRWRSPAQAGETPKSVAAANWRVAARLVASRRGDRGRGAWIDVGSTTTDLAPIEDGVVKTRGVNDTQRLARSELIYTGVRRTPVCALVERLPYRGESCHVPAEWFATTADCWLLQSATPEDANDFSTADGEPLVRGHSIARLARCVGADSAEFTEQDAVAVAAQVASKQRRLLGEAIRATRADWAFASGEGEFLAQQAAARLGAVRQVELASRHVGDRASACFPAHAAAVLASEAEELSA